MTKTAVVLGLLALTCLALPMGVMQLAEAVDSRADIVSRNSGSV